MVGVPCLLSIMLMVTIIAVQSDTVIVVYSQQFYNTHFHNGVSWQTADTATINMEIPSINFSLVEDCWFESSDFESDSEQTYLLNGQTADDFFFEFQGPGQSKQESGNTNNSGNHGVINYNFYNQQWQNSVDLEHAMESNGTSYGGAGGGDSAHQSNRTENLLLSGMQAAATILPLLADGLTEDFENSDRVSKTQAGASTLVTQHHTGCLTYPKPPRAEVSSAADEPTRAGPSVNRFITIPVGEWTSTNAVYSGWYLPLPYSCLQRNTPLAALARRHFMLNCGWRVQVQVNSTRFHGGSLLVAMVPQFVANGQNSMEPGTFSGQNAVTFFNLQSLFVYPHQILNPRTNSSAEVQVPYANITPGCDPKEQAPWSLVIMVISPLSYSAGATTSLEIVASVCPTDVEFHGIRQTNSDFQGLPKNKNDSSSYSFASTQPHYSQPDYGAMIRSSPRFLPAQITDLRQVSQIPTLTAARAISFQQVIPTSPLLTLNVSLSATDLVNTALETVSRGFAQYRGSILVRMLFTGNQMQNVRYVAAYTPPGADPPATLEEAMDGIYTIYDTGLNAASNFVIPFVSTTDYRFCNTDVLYDTGSGGYFTIWQLTNLAVPPGSPATAELLVFAATGEDFEFRCPTSPLLILQGEDTQVTPAESGATPQVTADNSNEATVPIPYSEQRLSHSAVRFWFDRFFLLDTISLSATPGSPTRYVLSWTKIATQLPEVRWFTHATYIRFEWEIALCPIFHDDMNVDMVFWPAGSFIPGGTTTWNGRTEASSIVRSGASPRWTWRTGQTPVFTTRLPFTSAASVFSNTYTGWNRWDHTSGSFGNPPGTDIIGALQLVASRVNAEAVAADMHIWVRMVDIQLFCPRPGQYLTPPAQNSRGASNFSLLALAGDVELNPGPFFMKAIRKLDPDMDELFKKFDTLRESFQKIQDFSNWMKLWDDLDKQKWLKRFVKMLSYAVVLSRARHDPLLAAATAFILTGDWMAKLCGKIVKHLKEHAVTQPPPLPTADDDPDEGPSTKGPSHPFPDSRKYPKAKAGKGLSVNSGDITRETPDVPLIDVGEGQFCPYPKEKNPFGQNLQETLEDNQNYLEKLAEVFKKKKPQEEPSNPFDEDETIGDKFKRFFKFQGPLQDMNSLLVLCRNAHWLGGQLQKLMDWLGLWKKQEEDASEDRFREMMLEYPQRMEEYEKYKNSPRHKKWNECKEWFDDMRKRVVHHDPKLVTLFPNMVQPEHQNSRQEPLLVVLRGPPGQGKSVAASILAQLCAHALTGKPDYYSYNSSTNYFDGYAQQPVVLIDDLGQDPAGTDFSVFCQMISTTPFLPNMASLADKGIKFTSDVIIATTNLADFKPVTIVDPGALVRRINFDYTVTAGKAFQKSNGTLDLERALEPTGCSAPLASVKTDVNFFSSACVNFQDTKARCSCSLVDVYDRIMAAHKNRNNISLRLQEIFSFEGPIEHDPRNYTETYPIKVPKKKDVERWCDMAIACDPHDDTVLSFLRRHCDHKIFGAYVRRFYGDGPDPTKPPRGERLRKFNEALGIILQVASLLLMLLSLGVVIWSCVNYQGPYSGNAAKREKKPNGLKVIDIASFQGPLNFDLERSILKKNTVEIGMREANGFESTTGGLAVKGRLIAMNFHLWSRATHLRLDGEWVLRESIPAIRPCANEVPTEIVFMNWAGTPGRQFRDITALFPSAEAGHFKLSPAARVTGLLPHMEPSFAFAAEALGTSESARTWTAVVPMVLKYKAQTAPGFCGATIIVDNGIWKKVFGIHCAGAHGVGMAAIISTEMVEAVCSVPQFQGKIQNVKEHAYIYTPHKTNLYPTVACDETTTVEPAALSPNDRRLEKPQEFKKTIMAKHIGDRTDGPLAMVQAARLYARLVRAKCGNVNERLSLREAVFGTANLDPMDMTRSPGWPYLGRARRPDLIDQDLNMDPVLRAELTLMMEGDFKHHKFVTFLKDELRDKEKVKQGKTRVIDIASFGHAIFGRVLFGRLAAAMHANNGVELGSAVGTNPDIDWTRYATEFKFGNFVDIDYSGFDATHSSYSFFCLKIFLKELGFDEIAMKYVDSLCSSTHIWDDEQFDIIGGLPSGCSCTSIFNTVLNNIIVRAFVPLVHDGEFQLLAYGDDLVLCADKQFDVDKYKWLLESLTNYKITPASKGGDFVWTDLGGVVFLKRYFVRDGLLVRPVMTYKNLHNILSWARAGTVQEKLSSVARLAQHRGEHDYKKLMAPFEECGYVVPPFDELELEFFSLFFG